MKDKLNSKFKETSKSSKLKRVVFSFVAIALLLVLSISVVNAWVESISTILISGDGKVDKPIYTDASVVSSSNEAIDLTTFFREAGNVHLSEASSADGVNFYFPVIGSTKYRKNNINDVGVNYINFKLKVKSDADKSFVFNQEPTIKIGDVEISNSAVRVAITLEGEQTKIFSLASSTDAVVASKTGSTAPTNVLKFSDYTAGNKNNNAVFTLAKNSQKELTVSIWLQKGIATSVSGNSVSIENISLVPNTPRYRVEASAITDGVLKDATGGTVQVNQTTAGAFSSENVEKDKAVTLTATLSSEEYLFLGWFNTETGGTAKTSVQNGLTYKHTFTPTANCQYYARFAKGCQVVLKTEYYNVDTESTTLLHNCGTVKAGNSTAGTDSRKTIAKGTSLDISATAKQNYKFIGWYSESGEKLYDDINLTLTNVNEKTTLHARFVDSFTFNAYSVTNNTLGSAGGTVKLNDNAEAASSTLEVIKNATVTAVAKPNESSGYEFVGWYDSDAEDAGAVSTNKTYTFSATADAEKKIYAKFYSKHSITAYAVYNGSSDNVPTGLEVKVSGGVQGTSSNITARYGSKITVDAMISDTTKYKFDGWYDSATGGNRLDNPASESYNFTVSENKEVYARFSIKGRTLYFQPSSNWTNEGARFAAYAFLDENTYEWYDMTESSTSGVYQVVVTNDSLKNIIFVRMNPNTTENIWENRWGDGGAQTVDLTIPTNNNNLFRLTSAWASTGVWTVNPVDVTGNTVDITLKDSTNSKWLSNNAPYFIIVDDATGNAYKITSSSTNTWVFTVPSNVTDVTFKRLDPNNLSNVWNSWSPSDRGSKKTFTVYESSTGWS